jgi:protease PrsW
VILPVAVAPTVFLFLFVYLRDKYEHEPLGLVGTTFVLGAIGMVPAAVIELVSVLFFSLGPIVDVFLCVALIEELIKSIAVRMKAYASPHFSEVMDGIVYTVGAGLGFATAENIIYVLQNGLSVALVRAFLSVPGHAFGLELWGST